MKDLLAQLLRGTPLTFGQAESAFTDIMAGTAEPAQSASLLTLLALREPTIEELQGAATVQVTRALFWGRNGVMTGFGRTVLTPGGRGMIAPGPWRSVYLVRRELVNAGRMTWVNGSIQSTGHILNLGLFEANSETGSLSGYDSPFGVPRGQPFLWPNVFHCGRALPDRSPVPDSLNV